MTLSWAAFLLLSLVGCGGQAVATKAIPKTLNVSKEQHMTPSYNFNLETKSVKLNSGYTMPVIGLGTYSLMNSVCVKSVNSALQEGYRLIDTANAYHNEAEVGEAVRNSGISREQIFITTKLYPNQYDNPEAAIEEALQKLNVEYIDLMLLHHPGSNDVKAYRAMEKYVATGKIRSLGLSCYYIKELDNFLPQVNIKPALVQNEIHPYYQDTEVVNYIQSKGIVVEGWYPLGGRGFNKELMQDKVLKDIGHKYGKSLVQIILRWNLQRGVVVIPGSSNSAHMKENMDIFDFSLTPEDMKTIAKLERKEKHDWY